MSKISFQEAIDKIEHLLSNQNIISFKIGKTSIRLLNNNYVDNELSTNINLLDFAKRFMLLKQDESRNNALNKRLTEYKKEFEYIEEIGYAQSSKWITTWENELIKYFKDKYPIQCKNERENDGDKECTILYIVYSVKPKVKLKFKQ